MPGQRGPAAAGEQAEPVGQPRRYLVDGQGAQPGGSQLDRERQAVEPAHDLDDVGHRRLVDDELGPGRGGPVGEQLDRRRCERERHGRSERRHGQRCEHHQRLAGYGQRLAAGRQHGQPRAASQERVDEFRHGVEQVLAVVDHEERPSGGKHAEQFVDRLRRPARRVGIDPGRRVAAPDRTQYRVRDLGRICHRCKLDEPDRVVLVEQRRCGLGGEARLARAASSDERHQPALVQQLDDPRRLLVPADEAGQGRAEVGPPTRPGRRTRRRSLAAQHGEVQLLQFGRRVDAELVDEQVAEALVRGQGIRRAARGPTAP